ncbi:MAG: DNA translocase FtsK 4TM domain-containing protein, partial [Putridiphycobacter sp.]|nr:DNA translocase FtsK 4TM domain-containing protein [Putridiphycobacter sp.]
MAKKANSYSKTKLSKSEAKQKKKVNFLKPIKDLFSKDRKKLRLSVGSILILIGIYQIFAFVSYLFTWQVDQDKVINKGLYEFLFNSPDISIDNHLGKLGAWISHTFIYEWFGISAFGFPFLAILFGLFLMTKYALFPLRRSLAISAVGIVVLSLVFGFFNSPQAFPYGGNFGFTFNEWLSTAVGTIGAALFHIVLVFISIVVLFNPDFRKIAERFNLGQLVSKSANDGKAAESVIVDDFVAVNTIKDEDIQADIISETVDLEDDATEFDSDQAENNTDNLRLDIDNEDVVDTAETSNAVHNTEEDSDTEDFQIEVKEEEATLNEDDLDDRLKEFGEYDPKLDLSAYQLPTIDLLEAYGGNKLNINKEELEQNKNKIVEVLGHYNIEISKIKATVGPTVTLYEIVPAPGIRISKIKNLSDDIALSLAALGIRIIAPIPGKGTIGIEVPNSNPDMVAMRTMISSEKFQNSDMELPVVLGKTISNETFIFDLAKAPHLLVAGATGQGKSVGLNAILVSILYKKHPSQVKFVMVDPKKVELTLYNKIERHFLAKLPDSEEAIITDTGKVVNTMNSLCIEMDDRYELLKTAQVRNLKEYNAKFIARKLNPENGHRFLP